MLVVFRIEYLHTAVYTYSAYYIFLNNVQYVAMNISNSSIPPKVWGRKMFTLMYF